VASVLVARLVDPGATGPAMAGVAAVVGHIYPVWLGFRGGKGVATTCGVFSVLAPQATAIATVAFLALVWRTRYISLGSVAGSVVLAPLAYVFGAAEVTVVAAALAAAIVVHRHRSNLRRVMAGSERRIGQRA
jgi:glycerol-3-phosphate acyltransferase PlsY